MPVLLDTLLLDDPSIAVREQLEELGGRDARTIIVTGILSSGALADLESSLDAIIQTASPAGGAFFMSIRSGRRLWVRRTAFTREVMRSALAGAFTLTLSAEDPLEESLAETEIVTDISAPGDSVAVATPGNAPSPVLITLLAEGTLVEPAISDEERTMRYMGTVATGERLAFDGIEGKLRLDGVDVTPYSEGSFPKITPAVTTLTYTGAATSTHAAKLHVVFHPKWY